MKDPFDRTKVVLRHLPPSFSQAALMEQIDGRFAGRYEWVSFRQGKNSQKQHRYSRAYIDFKRPEDVIEFAEFFDGHVFVNEKGAQFKTIVEYAPSQRVPKPWSKKDGREGTIFKDPEYLEFLELLAKPVENLPSAEIQLEKREAERVGAAKEAPIVTPLMDFIRQKRAVKGGSQRSSSNGKLSRRGAGASHGNSRSMKRGSEKRRASTSKYVLRDSAKNASGKEKSTYILVPRREDQQLSDKPVSVAATTGAEKVVDESGIAWQLNSAPFGGSGAIDPGKKKVLLLKGKEREVAQASVGLSQQQNVASPVRNSPGSSTSKHNQRCEASGRMIRSILSNKEVRQSQSSSGIQSEQQIQTLHLEKDKRPPRSTNMRLQAACSLDCDSKRVLDDKVLGNDLLSLGSTNEKQEKRTRNKDRPDRGVWTLRRSDGSHASDESLSSSSIIATHLLSDSLEAMTITQHVPTPGVSKLGDAVVEDNESSNKSPCPSGKPRNLDTVQNSRIGRGGVYDLLSNNAEMKLDLPNASKSGEVKTLGSIRSSSSVENGSHRHGGRRGSAHGVKDVDGSQSLGEGKPTKRGGATGYGSHEKQVWVQKSGSGS